MGNVIGNDKKTPISSFYNLSDKNYGTIEPASTPNNSRVDSVSSTSNSDKNHNKCIDKLNSRNKIKNDHFSRMIIDICTDH